MIYENCKSVIEAGFENQSFMTKELMILQVEMFNIAGKFSPEEYDELKALLTEEEVISE